MHRDSDRKVELLLVRWHSEMVRRTRVRIPSVTSEFGGPKFSVPSGHARTEIQLHVTWVRFRARCNLRRHPSRNSGQQFRMTERLARFRKKRGFVTPSGIRTTADANTAPGVLRTQAGVGPDLELLVQGTVAGANPVPSVARWIGVQPRVPGGP